MAGLFYVPGISSGITWIRFWSSYPPAAARSFSAPLTRRSFRHKRLNSDDCTLHAGSSKSPLSSGCFAIRRGPCRCSACQRHITASASATCKPLSNRELGIFRVCVFATLKIPKAVTISNLRTAPPCIVLKKVYEKNKLLWKRNEIRKCGMIREKNRTT